MAVVRTALSTATLFLINDQVCTACVRVLHRAPRDVAKGGPVASMIGCSARSSS